MLGCYHNPYNACTCLFVPATRAANGIIFGLAEDIYSCGYFRQEGKENIRLPYKWMAVESLNDNIFSEKSDVVIPYQYPSVT